MSTTIDQRVVSLQFDNKQFERNTATTMSTLDKLKEKLTFNKASKGLEDVGHAAKNVNMAGLGSGVEAVTAKFSALQVMGITALANITNSAVNAGKRMVKALTIDPVTTGFKEYETQINATQTILANTKSKGSTIDDVNYALEELNKYADKTIYNFTEMTRNIGTFTAAGVDLETSVNAIQGIANLAAVSGSTSQQASTAMYQLSQALSTGTVRLMDWNSVVNAGMGGEMFQNALRETSEELQTGAEAAIKANGSFRESLQTGWLTADVLTATLKKFTTSGANEYIAKYTGLSQDAIETTLREAEATAEAAKAKGKEADAIDIAAESLAKMSGKSKEQIKESLEFARTAEDAATKVKTFTQLWDVLKESAQSGWSQTWKIIVGDFEEAKGLLTPLADFLTGFINKISDWRNRILQVALDFSKPWKAISDKIGKVSDVVSKVTGTLEYFQDVVDKVWLGKFNNWGDNPDRRDLLKAAGYDPKVVQYLVNLGEEAHKAGKTYKLTAEDVEKAHKKYGKTVQLTAEETETAIDSFNSLSDAKLKDAGLTEDEIRLYRALEEEAAKAGVSVGELAQEMSEADGRTMLIDSFKNVGKLIGEIAGAAKEAWVDIFNPPSAEVLGVRLYGAIRSLKEFTESLTIVDKETGKLTKNGENIKSIFEGLFAAIDIVITLTAGPLKFVFKMATQLCKVLGISVLDVAGGLGEFIVGIRDGIDGILDFTKIFEKIVPPIKNALSAFKDWIGKLKESKDLPKDIAIGIAKGLSKAWAAVKNFFKNLPENISNGFDGISDSPLGGFIDKLKSGSQVAVDVVIELGKMIRDKVKAFLSRATFEEISADSVAGLAQGLRDKATSVWDAAVEMVKSLVQKVKDFLGIHSPSTVFIAIGGFIVAGLVGGITSALQNGEGGVLQGFMNFFTPIIEWVKNIDLGQVFAAVMGTGLILTAKRLLDIIDKFASPMESLGNLFSTATEILEDNAKNFGKVVKAFAKNLKAEAFKTRMEGFMIFVKALVLLLAAIAVLSLFPQRKLWSAFGLVAALGVLLLALVGLMNLVNKASVSLDKGGLKINGLMGGLIGIGLAILLIGMTVKMLGKLDEDQAKQGLSSLLELMSGLILVILALAVVSGFGGKIGDIGKSMFKVALAIGIIALTVKLLGGMNADVLAQGIDVLKTFVGVILVLMVVAALCGNGLFLDELGKSILKMSLAMAVMALVVKTLGNLPKDSIHNGIDAIIAFGLVIAGLMAATRLIGTGDNVGVIGDTILKIGIAIGIMALVVKLLGNMNREDIIQGGLAILAFSGIIVGLMAATRLAGGKARVKSIGTTILSIAGAIAILALVAMMLSVISWTGFAKGVAMIGMLSAFVAGLILATRLAGGKNLKNVGSCLIAIAGAIGILALIAVILGFVPVEKLKVGLIAVGFLALFMTALIAVTKNVSKDSLWPLVTIAGIVALLGGILIALSCLDPNKVAVASLGLSAVVGMMSLLVFITQYLAKANINKAILPLIALAVVVGLLGEIIVRMSNSIKNVDALMPSVAALSVLMVVMTGVLAALGFIGKMAKDAALGALALAAMAVPLLAFVGILALMQNVQVAMANVQALIILATAMTLLLIPLTLIGAAGMTGAPYLGVLALLAMAVPLLAFVGILALMSGIQNGIANTMALTMLITAIGNVLFKLSLVAPLAVIGVAALTALVGLIATIGIIATAIGALVTQFPQLQTFLDTGIPILEQLASGLGRIIGSFITGFAGEVMCILPQLGMCLSQFMINATPFIVGAKMVDEKVLAGVGILAGAIVALTTADLITGVMSFLQGGSSFADLGTQLSMFMMNAMPFIMGASMISEDMMTGVKMLADTILILTAANVIEGLTSWLTGGSSLEGFATQLPILGQGLAAFSSSLGAFTEDQLATVNCAAQAVKTLASAAAEIPNTGGLLASIVGENDLGVFAAQFPILGTGLASFLSNVGTFTEEQVATVNCAAQAIKSLAQASAEIPNTGGLLGAIVGENDLGTFAAQFPILGTGLRGFLDNVGTFTEEQVATIDCAASAIKSLASAASEIPNEGGWIGKIVGENNLGTFAESFPALGTGLAGFLTNAGTFGGDQVATINCAASAVKSLAAAAQSIPNEGGWISKLVGDNNLSTFASNFPSVGTGLKGFANNLGTFTSEQVNTVRSGVSALQALTGLAKVDLSAAKKNISGFGNKLPDFAKNLSSFCTGMPSSDSVTTAVTNIDKLLDSTKKIGDANSGVLKDFASNLKKVGDDAVKKFVGAFTSGSAKKDLQSAAKTLAGKAPDGAKEKKSAMESAGKDLGAGLVTGINAKKQAAYNAGYALGQKAVQGEKDGQQSKSPSKLTIKAGKWLGEGLVIGIDKMGRAVYNSGYALGESAVKSTSSAISRIADAINTDIDAQPTIRPIMDLSDVRAGASAIGNLLNTESSVGVVANAGRIGGMMNRYSQNRGNDDVVAAIDKLNKRMDNLGNTSYNINGITYDDGSNVRTAVETLVRAARIERRT